MIALIARRAFSGGGGGGLSSAKLSLLPDSALMPLKRDGLVPVAELAEHRERGGVERIKLPLGVRAWLITGYEEAKAVLGGTAAFSNDFRQLAGVAGFDADQDPGGLGFSDPPQHTRLRRVLTPEFTGRRLSRLAPRIEGIVTETIDALVTATEPVDLVAAFALPIPSLSICELLGVPYADREDFQRLSTARFDMLEGAEASLAAVNDSLPYLRGIVEAQRREPGEGLLGRLVRDHGDEFTDQELAGLADGLLTGGLETTTSMLALGTVLLLQDPAAMALLRDEESATNGAVDKFVEELLRYLTVVQVAFPRFAREDIEIGGTLIERGDVVVCSLTGANRDARLGADMETFDPHRGSVHHVAFGFGIHRCVGAELAKIELRAAFPALVRRFPDMKLAVAPEELSYRKRSIVHGIDRLPIDLGAPADLG
ncbi:cytochrome P450 [Pseudonocardia sp. GCM10023141]|uniref:cytochrome P450 n=1 Tax=Pseudonocardia sp. GCM10023141 TaxID=3252653 RepID=UPI00361AB4CC